MDTSVFVATEACCACGGGNNTLSELEVEDTDVEDEFVDYDPSEWDYEVPDTDMDIIPTDYEDYYDYNNNTDTGDYTYEDYYESYEPTYFQYYLTMPYNETEMQSITEQSG
jgi:hypothetical protein